MTPQQIEAMKLAFEAHCKDERHHTVAETRYWCRQYKLIAQAAIAALAEHAMSEVQRLGQEIEQCQCPECQIKPHASDCAVHSEPAYPKGKCDCGAQPESWEKLCDSNCVWTDHHPDCKLAQTEREWVELTDEDKNDCLVEADPCECLATPEAQELMRCVAAKLRSKNT